MDVAFDAFVVDGVFGALKVGSPWSDAVAALGTPEASGSLGEGRPWIYRYGDLEIMVRDDRIYVLSLRLDGDTVTIPGVVLNGYGDGFNLGEIRSLVGAQGIAMHRIDAMSDDNDDVFWTDRGVHLSFRGNVLGRIGAAPSDWLQPPAEAP